MAITIDLGGFVFDLPVWVMVFDKEYGEVGLPKSCVTRVSNEQGAFLPLFTERLFAERMIEGDATPPKIPLELGLEELRKLVNDFALLKGRYVGIDCESPGRPSGWFVRVAHFLSRLPEEETEAG